MEEIGISVDLVDGIVDLGHHYFCFYREGEKVNEEPKRIAQCLILVRIS